MLIRICFLRLKGIGNVREGLEEEVGNFEQTAIKKSDKTDLSRRFR